MRFRFAEYSRKPPGIEGDLLKVSGNWRHRAQVIRAPNDFLIDFRFEEDAG